MTLSILTPSNRNLKGLQVVEKALKRQRVSFEWIIGSPEKPQLDLDFIWVQDPPKNEGDVWVFNKLMNQMVRKASHDLIVSIQDYTDFAPDALEKFIFHYNNNNKSAVSGVGNKYTDNYYFNKVWQDPRERDDQGTFYETSFDNWEGNFASIPKSAIQEVGGFDEELDKHFGMDWYSVNHRIEALGAATFYLDQTNKSYSLTHDRYKGWEENNAIHGPFQERAIYYKQVNYKLGYN